MKGLLLKDFYMSVKYCRAFMLIIVVFIAISFFGDENTFFLSFPALIAGMIPVTLIAYEERCKWTVYSQTLPITRAQTVSSKYIVSLISIVAVIILATIVQAIRAANLGQFDIEGFAALMFALFAISLIVPGILLPLIFKFGSEKGRIAYYIIIGIVCAATVFLRSETFSMIRMPSYLFIVIGAAVFILSWFISIKVYEKREL